MRHTAELKYAVTTRRGNPSWPESLCPSVMKSDFPLASAAMTFSWSGLRVENFVTAAKVRTFFDAASPTMRATEAASMPLTALPRWSMDPLTG